MYRKLTKEELASYGVQLTNSKQEILAIIKKFYPSSANRAILLIDSEYNDNTYDNRPTAFVVYDDKSNEVSPLKGKEIDARKAVSDLYLEGYRETHESMSDLVIFVNQPELYIKE